VNPDLFPVNPVLLVDDEADLLASYSMVLKNAGINNVLCCTNGGDAADIAISRKLNAIVLDLLMPGVSGQELLSLFAARIPEVPVLVSTAISDVDNVVECMRKGAFDYMVKPVDRHRLVASMRRALEFRDLRVENTDLKRHLLVGQIERPEAFSSSVTNDDQMLSLFKYVEAVAPSCQPVFITGETGVGKELMAESLHKLSGKHGEFVAVNTAGLDDTIFADTFFGHVRGAYTGAETARAGLLEKADGGTLFMDEIGDLALTSQVKLLRLLQDGEYMPLGSDSARRSDARIIVATNRDIHRLMEIGKFREDLYFRLIAHRIDVPPLRRRFGDLPLLVDHFVKEAARMLGRKPPLWPEALVTHLSAYHFPGNIRELRSMVYNAVSNHQSGVLSLSSFVEHMNTERSSRKGRGSSALDWATSPGLVLELPTIEQAYILLIREALRRTNGNQTAAANLLGLSRQTVNKYCSGMQPDDISTPG